MNYVIDLLGDTRGYDLGSSAPNTVIRSSQLTLLQKKLRDHGADHFKKKWQKFLILLQNQIKCKHDSLYLINLKALTDLNIEPVQERLKKCNISLPPSKENLVDVIIILCMQSADVASLCINHYEALDEIWDPKKIWYNPKYSWYYTSYSKIKEET